jgi:hypothetical protein
MLVLRRLKDWTFEALEREVRAGNIAIATSAESAPSACPTRRPWSV